MAAHKLTPLLISYHRNGVSGAGFWAVVFEAEGNDYDNDKERMLGTVFESTGHCAVVSIDRLPDIRFSFNSWRGDHFEPQLRDWIKKAEDGELGMDQGLFIRPGEEVPF